MSGLTTTLARWHPDDSAVVVAVILDEKICRVPTGGEMFLRARSPVDEAAAAWIDGSHRWFRQVVGEAPLGRPVAVPGTGFLPDGYRGSRDDVDAVLAEIFDYLEMDQARVEIDYPGDSEARLADLPDSF